MTETLWYIRLGGEMTDLGEGFTPQDAVKKHLFFWSMEDARRAFRGLPQGPSYMKRLAPSLSLLKKVESHPESLLAKENGEVTLPEQRVLEEARRVQRGFFEDLNMGEWERLVENLEVVSWIIGAAKKTYELATRKRQEAEEEMKKAEEKLKALSGR